MIILILARKTRKAKVFHLTYKALIFVYLSFIYQYYLLLSISRCQWLSSGEEVHQHKLILVSEIIYLIINLT